MDWLGNPILLGVIFLSVLYVIIKTIKGSKNMPPGPKGLPILGSYYEMKPTTWKAFHNMGLKFGGVVRVYIGRQPYILLTNYKAVREALITKADNFSGRMKSKFGEKTNRKSGIIPLDGPIWQEHRRFSLHTLRDFGFGRNSSEEVIQTELDGLFAYIDARITSPINIIDLLLRTVSNVICTLTLGEQPGYDINDEFGEVIKKLRFNIKTPFVTEIPFMFPRSTLILKVLQYLPSVGRRIRYLNDGHDYIKSKIAKHRETIDYEGEPRDFTDVYLQQKHKNDALGEPHTFTEWQLIRVIFELFIAGTDTTSNSISWGLLWLALRPEIQSKIHKEIDDKIGRSKPVTFKDRKDMPYTQALMDEIQRWASIVPNSLTHRNFKADTIQGFHIPANSAIIPCIYSVHHDPQVWEKPEDFYPEHFLDASGTQYRTRDELIAFSVGRRSCLGESLARMEYFIFFVSLVRRYTVTLNPACKDKLDDILMGTDGTIRSPGNHELMFKLRE